MVDHPIELPSATDSLPSDRKTCLLRYVEVSSARRYSFVSQFGYGATYIDLYASSPSQTLTESNARLAFRAAASENSPFSTLYIVDTDGTALATAEQELKDLGARVRAYHGKADAAVRMIVSGVNKSALHFAFLHSPHPKSLPFRIIEDLAQLQHIDLLVQVDMRDVQRHLARYLDARSCPLDAFAPGWRKAVVPAAPLPTVRRQLFDHWLSLFRRLGLSSAYGVEQIADDRNQSPYWLAFATRHFQGLQYWEKIRVFSGQSELPIA